jgi:hypothetical protein
MHIIRKPAKVRSCNVVAELNDSLSMEASLTLHHQIPLRNMHIYSYKSGITAYVAKGVSWMSKKGMKKLDAQRPIEWQPQHQHQAIMVPNERTMLAMTAMQVCLSVSRLSNATDVDSM